MKLYLVMSVSFLYKKRESEDLTLDRWSSGRTPSTRRAAPPRPLPTPRLRVSGRWKRTRSHGMWRWGSICPPPRVFPPPRALLVGGSVSDDDGALFGVLRPDPPYGKSNMVEFFFITFSAPVDLCIATKIQCRYRMLLLASWEAKKKYSVTMSRGSQNFSFLL